MLYDLTDTFFISHGQFYWDLYSLHCGEKEVFQSAFLNMANLCCWGTKESNCQQSHFHSVENIFLHIERFVFRMVFVV